VLLHDLGTAFRGEALSYKPYPCGRPLHAAIDAALAARARLEIERRDDIESVTVEADPAGHNDQFGRGPAKRRPTQVVEAQFAQPFLVATALVHGKVGIAEGDGLGMPRFWRFRIGSPASRGMADRKGRSASRFKGPTGVLLPSRPAIQLGRQRSRSPMLSSRLSSATARVMRRGRCRMQVWTGYWRQLGDWKRCRMRGS
jgi:2-methylcitrate dehydratase MmgE/PrpD-like protein